MGTGRRKHIRGVGSRTARQDAEDKRDVEYRIPRLHSPVNSRRFLRFPEISLRTK